ncbi:hypothetical protein OG196_42785 [Kitasatospora purpeofusca]|uniref:hypothetical protein n=1 Tax=Kitasatospora purpeofusca TaxID=67352 RepID=UPI002E0D3077|nr:hypothetical protein OG196_00140 [Kitasatospora purpeofusca]WSR45233.1 hypothetical protein OG196_42785 [Kitasatospora purpeofusca]
MQAAAAALPLKNAEAGPAMTQAGNDLHVALGEVYQQRRIRIADTTKGIPTVLIRGLIGTGALALVFPVLMGWPTGWRYVVGLGLLAGAMGFGVWMVLQLNMP